MEFSCRWPNLAKGSCLLQEKGREMIIPDYVEKNARLYPNKTAIKVAGGRSCSFLEFQERVYRLANGLLKLGIVKGDRVAVLSENCFEYPELYMGIAKAGGIITPMNFRFIPAEVSALTQESGAAIFVVQDKYAESMRAVLPDMKSVREVICIGNAPPGMISYEDLIADSPAAKPEVDISINDIYCLVHTGGTTGTPKLTMLTHRNLLSCATFFIVEMGYTYGDIFMIISPIFHTGASWPLFWTFVLGNTFIILEKFDALALIKAVDANKVSASLWMSQLVPNIINHPDVIAGKYDLSSLRILLVGGSVLPEPHLRRLMELLPGIRIGNMGGQTECGLFTSIKLNEYIDTSPEKLNSAGIAGFNMQIKIVDKEDNELPVGVEGELCVRGEGVMLGYWNKPQETEVSLRGGWQHTGDICKIDEDGFLYYVDRLKDMIKSGGENVYSKEVEEVLYTHPAVFEAAVVGVPDEKWGEAVQAFIVLKEGQKAPAEELIDHCRKTLAGFKCPKGVEFRDSLPKTGLGKINKKAIRDPYWEELNRKI
jgi:long-chain acyl-CoA synthetase